MVTIPNDNFIYIKEFTIIMPWIGEETPEGWEDYTMPARQILENSDNV